MNIIKFLFSRSYRQQRRQQRDTLRTLRTYGWIEHLFQTGLLSFDRQQHRLFITQSLAYLLMQRGADAWVNAVHHIYNYTHLTAYQQACADYIQREELAAVRRAVTAPDGFVTVPEASASGKHPLSRADIDRIRRARCMELTQHDMPDVKVEPFEFFIIPDTTAPKVEPLAIGHYDPATGHMDIASWNDVKQLLSQAK